LKKKGPEEDCWNEMNVRKREERGEEKGPEEECWNEMNVRKREERRGRERTGKEML
jgi:hypothetical protein